MIALDGNKCKIALACHSATQEDSLIPPQRLCSSALRNENLFQAPQHDAMTLFMWQEDIIGVARFIDACLECTHQLALPWGTRHLISRELAGTDVYVFFLLQPQIQGCVQAGRGGRRTLISSNLVD